MNASTTSKTKRHGSIVGTPGSPDSRRTGHAQRPGSNPDGKTPVDIPSASTSLHDQPADAPKGRPGKPEPSSR